MSGRMGANPMHAMLRRYRPPEGQILLLTAALADPATARRAWLQWIGDRGLDQAPDPELRLLAAVARRMPELMPGTPPDPRLAGAQRYIWTRTHLTLGTTLPLLATLRAEGHRLMLIKGAAQIAADPALLKERALRDVDVLIHPDDWQRVLHVVRREGWSRGGWQGLDVSMPRAHATSVWVDRPNAVGSLDLHFFVLKQCRNIGQDRELWERAVPASLQGVDLLRVSTTDQALITLGQAMLFDGGRQPAHWALDVDPMVRSGRIDWGVLLREAHVRRVEMFVAAPLLLLQEIVQCPVPKEVLRDLTRPIGKAYLVEYEMRATGWGPRHPEQFDALRITATGRALRAARAHPATRGDPQRAALAVVRRARIGPNERMEIPVPFDAMPFERLRLEISFRIHRARGHARLTLESPGLGLMLVPIERAGRKAGGRVRRREVLRCPACLFAMRGIAVVQLKTNDRLEIRGVEMRWGPPLPASPLTRAVAALQRLWRAR